MKNLTRKAIRTNPDIVNPYDFKKANREFAKRYYYKQKEQTQFDLVKMNERLSSFLAPYIRLTGIKVLSHTVQVQIHDHETVARLTLYVQIEVRGERFFKHTSKNNFIDAIYELSCWLQAVVVGEEMGV